VCDGECEQAVQLHAAMERVAADTRMMPICAATVVTRCGYKVRLPLAAGTWVWGSLVMLFRVADCGRCCVVPWAGVVVPVGWMSGLGEPGLAHDESLRDLGVVQPVAISASTSASRAVRPSGSSPGSGWCGPRRPEPFQHASLDGGVKHRLTGGPRSIAVAISRGPASSVR
jgi:hypothetical protein